MTNELYLVVLPLIHLTERVGLTEQVLTLFPEKRYATKFFPEQVDTHISLFQNRTGNLSGGHVTGYEVMQIIWLAGRFLLGR